MKLVTFTTGDNPRIGALEEGGIRDISVIAATMLDLIGLDGDWRAKSAAGELVPLERARLLVPLMPSKVLCSGVNYRGHAEENPSAVMPEEPFFFAKLPNAITGPEAEISISRTQKLDYEVEFAVVIGKRLSRASEAEIMPAIFGYTLLNDVSARDVQFKDGQITLGKNFDGFAPIGPWIVTTDEMPNPNNVGLRTRLNGRILQDGNTSDWLFPLPRLIAFLSQTITLLPGDVVTTGTPAGVGLFQKPPVFMQPGDVIEIEGDGLGMLRNRIVV